MVQQFFVKDTLRARTLMYNKNNKVRKFSSPKKRALKTSNMYFFDWLINNCDRNLDNYLILPTGKFVLIDHGLVLTIHIKI